MTMPSISFLTFFGPLEFSDRRSHDLFDNDRFRACVGGAVGGETFGQRPLQDRVTPHFQGVSSKVVPEGKPSDPVGVRIEDDVKVVGHGSAPHEEVPSGKPVLALVLVAGLLDKPEDPAQARAGAHPRRHVNDGFRRQPRHRRASDVLEGDVQAGEAAAQASSFVSVEPGPGGIVRNQPDAPFRQSDGFRVSRVSVQGVSGS